MIKKITINEIESMIDSYEYVIRGTMTQCYITMKNGFVVTGESACMNQSDFKKELGEKLSRENAFAKIWSYLGFYRMQRDYEKNNNM